MRRILGLVVVLSIALIPAVAALATTADYADDFSGGGYSDNDGSLDFGGDWFEFGDTGGAGSGKVHIGEELCSNNLCLHLEGGGVVLTQFGIERPADLSIFNSAQLKFDLRVQAQLLDTASLQVQGWDGSTWRTLATYSLATSSTSTKNIPLNAVLCEQFKLRFVVPALGLLHNGALTIDKVSISGSLMETTTTTTTTTSTSSTTSTTAPTTTSTSTPTTTSTIPTTTSTHPEETTSSTTDPATTTTTRRGDDTPTPTGEGTGTTDPSTTTTTSSDGSTSTSIVVAVGDTEPPPSDPFDGGLRDTGVGLISDYHAGMNGDMFPADVEVLSAEVTANFSLAVERIGTAKIWVAALALMIAAAVVSGMDSRRTRRATSSA